MKQEEVPQDKSNLSTKNVRELCYAIDKDGNYTTVLSQGWEPKTIALNNSIQEIEERIERARTEVKEGKVSPIVYYMELHKMDLIVLSDYVGMWQWRIKRHFKPSIFAKLSGTVLKKYADAFDVTVSQLTNYKGD